METLMGTTLLILDDGNEHRGDRSNQLFGLISPTQADRLAAGGFVAPDRRRTQSLGEKILQNAKIENAAEARDSGSWCCGTRRPRFE
jgi:hypothetical protein